MRNLYKMVLVVLALGTFAFQGNAQDYRGIIESYIDANASKLDFEPAKVDFAINSATTLANKDNRVVYLSQAYNGVKINGTSAVVIINNGIVRHFNYKFENDIEPQIAQSQISLSKMEALSSAVNQLGLGGDERVVVSDYKSGEDLPVSQVDESITVPMYFQKTDDGYRLAYEMIIKDNIHWWTVKIDAQNGEILLQQDLVITCNFDAPRATDQKIESHENHAHTTERNGQSILVDANTRINTNATASSSMLSDGAIYNAYPLRVESPLHGERATLIDPANVPANPNTTVVPSPFGWHDLDGNPGNEETITRGNNVAAYEDVMENDAPSGTDAFVDGGATLEFDNPIDFTMQPVTYLDAATVNLFVWNNYVHDVWYNYGFDETSGNFQESTYDREIDDGDILFGYAGDSVNAEAQDESQTATPALNNANMATSFDGSNPRMQMYLWGAAPFGDFVIVHSATGDNAGLVGTYYSSKFPFADVPSPADPELRTDLIVAQDDMTPYMGADGGTPGPSTDSDDGCTDYVNDVTGKIVVIRRGVCAFATKIRIAESEGAVGVIMVNNDTENPDAVISGGGTPDDPITIPAVFVSFNSGDPIIAAINAGETVNAQILDPNAGGVMTDGDLDQGIIAHEYGHGISTRLTGGRTMFTCLTSVMEAGGEQMGEGWSDWFGLVMTQQLSHTDSTLPRGIGTYVLGQDELGSGIRPARYSTDFTVNDYTYGRLPDDNITVPHGVGFVWATIIWDMYWDFIEEYGFDADMYNGSGGNNMAMQLVMDGLKIQNCADVGFVEGRDAIITADAMLYDGANECLIRNSFAKRGVGFLAQQGTGNSRLDQVEDFTLDDPAGIQTPDCDAVLGSTDVDTTIFTVFPNPAKNQININSNVNGGIATVALFDINGRQVMSTKVDLTNTGIVNISSLSSGVYVVKINTDSASHTQKLVIN